MCEVAGVEVDPETLAASDCIEGLPGCDEVVGDLGWMYLEPEPDPFGIEHVDDRRPRLGEPLVGTLDLAEVIRRKRVEQVPDRRPGKPVHLRDAEAGCG